MAENESTEESHKQQKQRNHKKRLYVSILQQMEFYFSDAALSKDRFLSQMIVKDPFVPIETFLSFNKIKQLTLKTRDIAKALARSTLLQLSEDGEKVKRIKPLTPYDADARTVYVESIPASANLKWITDVFQAYGPVAYVSLPKYTNTNRMKGFAFVEYETPNDAEKCLKAFTSMGCKLPTTIKPDELRCCPKNEAESTEGIKLEEKEEGVEDNSITEPPAKKIKICNENPEMVIFKETIENSLIQTTLPLDNPSEISEASELDNSGPMDEGEKKSKPVRKRKKKDRKKHDKYLEKKTLEESVKGLQILSKKEWKVLRNKYLNTQRKHMEVLKRALRTQHTLPNNRGPPAFATSEPQNEKSDNKSEIKPTEIQFVEGVIIAAILSEPCLDVKKLKQATKANVHVKYVDVKEGSTDIYLRMDDNTTAKQFASSGIFPEARILEGEEEKLYWDELKNQQYGRSSSKRKTRGRDRLMNKAQQIAANVTKITPITQTGKHIRFDD